MNFFHVLTSPTKLNFLNVVFSMIDAIAYLPIWKSLFFLKENSQIANALIC